MTEPNINSVGELVERLGGFSEAAKRLDCHHRKLRVWVQRGAIPARHYFNHLARIKDTGFSPSPSIWKFESSQEAS